jgi:adenylyl-sulfate kinase
MVIYSLPPIQHIIDETEGTLLMNKGLTVWFTGLPCSGKSTLARLLHRKLKGAQIGSEILDGDEVRQRLTKGLGFSKEDRIENVRRIAYVAKLLTRNGVIAIAALISPYRAVRDEIKQDIGRCLEVFVDCPVEVCKDRDVKGMYKKAMAGEIKQFTGVDDPYEIPLHPDLLLSTSTEPPQVCLSRVLKFLSEGGYLPKELS